MFNEQAQSQDFVGAALATAKRMDEGAAAKGYYTLQCLDKDGKVKWESVSPNLVVNVGLQDMNTKYFKGAAYTASWFIGLYGPLATNTPAAGDNLVTHPGWSEVTPYSGTRPAATFGTATLAMPSVISNSVASGGTVASFTINASQTVGGAFLCSVNSGTSGILFSASDFTSPGDRVVVSGDTLNVTYTFSLTAT